MSRRKCGVIFIALSSLLFITIGFTGNVFGEVRIIPSISVRETYNSNVENVGNGRYVLGDFETSVSPGIAINNNGRGFNLSGSYRANTYFYSRNPNLDYLGHSFNINLSSALSNRTSLSVTDTFRITENSWDVAEAGIQTRRTRTSANSANISMVHQASPNTSVSIGLSDRSTEYNDQALFDNRTDTADFSLNYQWMAEMSIGLSYRYSIYAFDQGGYGSNESSESVNLNIGYEKSFSSAFSSNFSAGISSYAGFYNTTVFVGQANIEKRFKNSSVSLAYFRRLNSTTGLSSELYINDSIRFLNSYTVSDQMVISINGTVTKISSSSTGADETISYTSGISGSWQVTSWMRFGFGGSHYEQKTDSLLVEDFSRDRVYINISASYDGWRF